MTSSDLESQRQTILHFWKKGVCKPQEIHKLTSIPLSTIKYNTVKPCHNEFCYNEFLSQRIFDFFFFNNNKKLLLHRILLTESHYTDNEFFLDFFEYNH
jgi:hypothetical protein